MSGKYLTFIEARKKARQLGLVHPAQWFKLKEYGIDLQDIPTDPHLHYSNDGWIDFSDFLGLNQQQFLRLDEVAQIAPSLGIRTARDWRRRFSQGRLPENMPALPDVYYGEKFVSFNAMLGRSAKKVKVTKQYCDYKSAVEIVAPFQFDSKNSYYKWLRGLIDKLGLPPRPDIIYGLSGEWLGWPAFLGRKALRVSESDALSYVQARAVVVPLNLKTRDEWQKYLKMHGKPHPQVPFDPRGWYSKTGEWIDWQHFLMAPLPEHNQSEESGTETIYNGNGAKRVDYGFVKVFVIEDDDDDAFRIGLYDGDDFDEEWQEDRALVSFGNHSLCSCNYLFLDQVNENDARCRLSTLEAKLNVEGVTPINQRAIQEELRLIRQFLDLAIVSL